LSWMTSTQAGPSASAARQGRADRMPVPADAGRALAGYLANGRPVAGTRALLSGVRAKAPFTGCVRPASAALWPGRPSGLGIVHGHRRRHTAAAATLNAGATLEEVAQLLRHEGIATTAVYAKTDRARLAQLARPWPADGARRSAPGCASWWRATPRGKVPRTARSSAISASRSPGSSRSRLLAVRTGSIIRHTGRRRHYHCRLPVINMTRQEGRKNLEPATAPVKADLSSYGVKNR